MQFLNLKRNKQKAAENRQYKLLFMILLPREPVQELKKNNQTKKHKAMEGCNRNITLDIFYT